MTFCKTLKSENKNGKTVTAYEKTEKNAAAPEYEIVISIGSLGYQVIPAARTTWKNKFKSALNEL